MWDVVWRWKFIDHGKISYSDITSEELPENVSLIPTELNMQDAYDTEVVQFQDKIWDIIEDIIKNWIIDYLDSINKINTPKTREIYEKETGGDI